MKKITEFRPLSFSDSMTRAERRRACRCQFRRSCAAIAGYVSFGLWLAGDTGYAPWDWQFWTTFAPLFVACELALWTIGEDAESDAAQPQ